MQMQSINPRYPHWVKVTRTDVDSSVNPPVATQKEIFQGNCRNYPSRNGSSGMTEGVIVSDYTISIPFSEIDFQAGDSTEVTDRTKTFTGVIVNSYNGNLGCVIWHNKTNT